MYTTHAWSTYGVVHVHYTCMEYIRCSTCTCTLHMHGVHVHYTCMEYMYTDHMHSWTALTLKMTKIKGSVPCYSIFQITHFTPCVLNNVFFKLDLHFCVGFRSTKFASFENLSAYNTLYVFNYVLQYKHYIIVCNLHLYLFPY